MAIKDKYARVFHSKDEKMISNFIKKLSNAKIEYIKLGNKYYLADEKLLQIDKSIGYEALAIGLFLGEEKEGIFYPSLALLELIAKDSSNKVIVNMIGEIDFIYGKDLKARHIKEVIGEFKVGYLKLVQNENDENIGLGKITKNLNEEGVVLKNKIDRGDFLRREK